MVSLRNTLTEILDTSSLSVRSGMQQLGFDGLASVSELVRAVVSGNTGQFTPLLIESDGTGVYRADRLRIYFMNPQSGSDQGYGEIPIATRLNEFGNLFPQIFNGFGRDVNSIERIEQNTATTFYRHDKPFNGEPTLQFTFDVAVLFNSIDVPDFHDDWVGFVHQDSFSFAVQTLKRHFWDVRDPAFGLFISDLIIVGAFGTGSPIIGLITGSNAGLLAAILNRYHFLAGRRSWRIGRTIAEYKDLTGDVIYTAPAFFLETAAITQISTWVVDLLKETGNLGIGEIDEMTKGVWKRLLLNYLSFSISNYGYESISSVARFGDSIIVEANAAFSQTEPELVFVDEGNFQSKEELFAQTWVQETLQHHPGIASQF